MGGQFRLKDQPGRWEDQGISPVVVADPRLSDNIVHLMQQDVLARLNGDKDAPKRSRQPALALVTIPVTLVAAICLVPVVVATVGTARVARGRFRGLGTDSALAARAVWRATDAAVGALLDAPTSRRH
jgi:hypothetical protein